MKGTHGLKNEIKYFFLIKEKVVSSTVCGYHSYVCVTFILYKVSRIVRFASKKIRNQISSPSIQSFLMQWGSHHHIKEIKFDQYNNLWFLLILRQKSVKLNTLLRL